MVEDNNVPIGNSAVPSSYCTAVPVQHYFGASYCQAADVSHTPDEVFVPSFWEVPRCGKVGGSFQIAMCITSSTSTTTILTYTRATIAATLFGLWLSDTAFFETTTNPSRWQTPVDVCSYDECAADDKPFPIAVGSDTSR